MYIIRNDSSELEYFFYFLPNDYKGAETSPRYLIQWLGNERVDQIDRRTVLLSPPDVYFWFDKQYSQWFSDDDVIRNWEETYE